MDARPGKGQQRQTCPSSAACGQQLQGKPKLGGGDAAPLQSNNIKGRSYLAISTEKYTTLVSNTLLFAISNFSSKLLSFFIRPYLSYALDSPDVMGVSSLLQQATNLLIPVVSLGVAYAVIRFGPG